QGPRVVVDRRFVSMLVHIVVPLVSQDLRHRPQHGRGTRRQLVSAARIAGVPATPADREHRYEVRGGRGFSTGLVDLHGTHAPPPPPRPDLRRSHCGTASAARYRISTAVAGSGLKVGPGTSEGLGTLPQTSAVASSAMSSRRKAW